MFKKSKKVKIGRPKGAAVTGLPVEFSEYAIYTAAEAAAILRRNVAAVCRLCRMGRLVHRRDGAGYIISGRALLAYAENRCVAEVKNDSETVPQ